MDRHRTRAIRLPVQGVDGFRLAYDVAAADAEIVDGVFEVDLWDHDIR